VNHIAPVQTFSSILRLSFLLLSMAVLNGCRSLDREVSASSIVTRVRGEAHHSIDEGQTWKVVRQTRTLPSGCLLRTGTNAGVELNLSGYESSQRPNIVRVSSDSLLRIDAVKVNWFASQKFISEIQLTLLEGSLMGGVKNIEDSSSYQVKFPGGLISASDAVYTLNTLGIIGVCEGRVSVKMEGDASPISMEAGYLYDARTKQITPVCILCPIISPRPLKSPDVPRIPQRRF
jgi:hypothetical protein